MSISERQILALIGLPLHEDHEHHGHCSRSLHDVLEHVWLHHLHLGTTTYIYMSPIFTCCIFSSINKCQKFTGYLAAIRGAPRYGPQRHLHTWPGHMDGRAPAHLLLHSGVVPTYPCGAPLWWATDCCRAARRNERASEQISPLHSWPMSSMFHKKLVRFWHQFVVSFVHRINRRRNKDPVHWRAEHTPYLSLWNARGSSQ
jgi:hypothetical protein